MSEEKIISVTPISKEENLYYRVIQEDGTLEYYMPIVAMVLTEYDSYNGSKMQTIRYVYHAETIENDEPDARFMVGRVDEENNTFEPLEYVMCFDENGKPHERYILLNNTKEVACDRFGNVAE